MIDFLVNKLNYWHWSCLGLVLLSVELFFPGGFLIWIGCAALITATLTYAFDFLFVGQMLSFSFISILCVGLGTRFYHPLKSKETTNDLNRKTDQMIGLTFRLSDPIINGIGHATVGDSRWRIIGKDTPAGTNVVVINIRGNSLVVEKAASLDNEKKS